jgi:hypothetical protein
VVTYDIVHQASLSSTEYPRETNEFIKAGLTMQPSEKIRPFRVKESPVQYECKVRDVIQTGDQGGAANLVICEVLLLHIDQEILREDGSVDPDKIRLVGRMGRDYYARAFGEAVFEVQKPIQKKGIGIDQLPEKIRNSKILTGNELGMLGNLEKLPGEEEIRDVEKTETIKAILQHPDDSAAVLITLARRYLHEGKAYEALKILMV